MTKSHNSNVVRMRPPAPTAAPAEVIAARVALLCELLRQVESASQALEWWVDDEEEAPVVEFAARWRLLLPSEYMALRGDHSAHRAGWGPGRHGWGVERRGALRARRSGRVLAVTTALVLPERLPRAVRREVGLGDGAEIGLDFGEVTAAVPLGTSLTAHYVDIRRDAALAEPVNETADRETVVALSRAVLVVDGLPAALATERYTDTLVREFAPPADLVATLADLAGTTEPADLHVSRPTTAEVRPH